MTYHESAVRPLPKYDPDENAARRTRRGGGKVIAFSGAPARRTRPSSGVRYAARQRKLFVTYPQYLSVALLAVFFYLRLALFADAPFAALYLLWLGAYALAGVSLWNTRRLKRRGAPGYDRDTPGAASPVKRR